MMTAAAIATIVAMLGWLVLNVRALDAHGLSARRKFQFGVAWAIIIAALAIVLSGVSP